MPDQFNKAESDSPAREYLNRAITARKHGNYDLAILDLDICLCSTPEPSIAIIAWYELSGVIAFKFNFLDRNANAVTVEEYVWHLRVSKCLRNVIDIYEKVLAHATATSEGYYRKIYEQVKGRFSDSSGAFLTYFDEDGVLHEHSFSEIEKVDLSPLLCLDVENINVGRQNYIKEQYQIELQKWKGDFLRRLSDADTRLKHDPDYIIERAKLEMSTPVKLINEGKAEQAIHCLKGIAEETDSTGIKLIASIMIIEVRVKMYESLPISPIVVPGGSIQEEVYRYCNMAIESHAQVHPKLQQMFNVDKIRTTLDIITKVKERSAIDGSNYPAEMTHKEGGKSEGTSSKAVLVGSLAVLILLCAVAIIAAISKTNKSTSLRQGLLANNFNQPLVAKYVDIENLNLRTGPGISYGVITDLRVGTLVSLTGERQVIDNSIWVKVRVGTNEGWLNQKFLSNTKPEGAFAEERWAQFWKEFCAAVKGRDKAWLKNMMKPAFLYSWGEQSDNIDKRDNAFYFWENKWKKSWAILDSLIAKRDKRIAFQQDGVSIIEIGDGNEFGCRINFERNPNGYWLWSAFICGD